MSGWTTSVGTNPVACSSLSQYQASRASLSTSAVFDAKSRREYAAFASSAFAPTEVPARNS